MIIVVCKCPYCGFSFREKLEVLAESSGDIPAIEVICPKCKNEFEREFTIDERDQVKDKYFDEYADYIRKDVEELKKEVKESPFFSISTLLVNAKIEPLLSEEDQEKITNLIKEILERALKNMRLQDSLDLLNLIKGFNSALEREENLVEKFQIFLDTR